MNDNDQEDGRDRGAEEARAEKKAAAAEEREEGRRELGRKGIFFGTLISVLAVAAGAVAGFIVTLAIVVLKARADSYVFGMDELASIRWETLPILLGMWAGVGAAIMHPRSLDRGTFWGLAGIFAGIVVGYPLGGALWGPGEGQWAGAIVFAALGMLIGFAVSVAFHRPHRKHRPLLAGGLGSSMMLAGAVFVVMGMTRFVTDTPVELPPFEAIPVPEPSSVDAVVFLLGDAGATDSERSPLLRAMTSDVERWSEALGRDSAVSIVYLGDLVYPVGVRDRDHEAFPTDSARLWNEINLVAGEQARRHRSLGLFLAGNHDWGNVAGDVGIDRLVNLEAQLEAARRQGLYVSLHPPPGDPGPTMRDLRRNVRLIFLDTHWFLQARTDAERDAFFDRLASMIEEAGDREVILSAHHPYRSAGPHGAIVPGYHAMGVAYLLKKSGTLVQDLNSPIYSDFLTRIRDTFEELAKPPLVFAGGHDHSLQVLQSGGDFDPRFSVVSGSGSKVSSIAATPGLVWGGAQPGYMMLVFREDDAVDLFVVGGDPAFLKCEVPADDLEACMAEGSATFEIQYSTSLLGPSKRPVRPAEVSDDSVPATPWGLADHGEVVELPGDADEAPIIPAPVAVPGRILGTGVDSVTTTPGKTYPAGRIHRFLFGDLHRHLWREPITLPVLDLGAIGGGLRPIELTGGQQTIGLRFEGADGLEYEFRAIVKDPSRALPEFLRTGAVDEVLDDQMAAQFPLAAVVVGELIDAAGIVAPRPVPSVMPNDPRLGEYRSLFAGRVGLFVLNANERDGGEPGFAGYSRIVGGDRIYEILRDDPESRPEAGYYLRIRLIDMLVGDWDRHSGQWRWGALEGGDGTTLWRAIPQDRDWAFVRIDGLVNRLGGLLMPKYVGFGLDYPEITRLAHSGYRIDHRILNGATRRDFLAAAAYVRTAITDSVIEAAVARLPESYRELEGEFLVSALKQRRDRLAEAAGEFYDAMAETVHVYGHTETKDAVVFEPLTEERVRVQVRSGGRDGTVRFQRLVDGRETDEVRVFIDENDVIVGDDDLPFDVTEAEDDGDDRDY